MPREYTKQDCPLFESEYCARLNMESCRSCTLNCEDEEGAERIREDLDAINALVPEEGLAGLFATDECMLCKGTPGKKEWFALTDLGHAQPKRRKAGFLGLSKEPKAGTVLPVQISCCGACKRRILLIEYAFPAIAVAFAVLALVLMSVRSIREPIAAVAAILPLIVFAAIAGAGIALGAVVKRSLIKEAEKHMLLDIMDAPILQKMADRGWFELYENSGCSKLVFSKTPAKQGLYTAAPEAEVEAEAETAAEAPAGESQPPME